MRRLISVCLVVGTLTARVSFLQLTLKLLGFCFFDGLIAMGFPERASALEDALVRIAQHVGDDRARLLSMGTREVIEAAVVFVLLLFRGREPLRHRELDEGGSHRQETPSHDLAPIRDHAAS